jgi:hypothetical protein
MIMITTQSLRSAYTAQQVPLRSFYGRPHVGG